jgi:hypothetical protein
LIHGLAETSMFVVLNESCPRFVIVKMPKPRRTTVLLLLNGR